VTSKLRGACSSERRGGEADVENMHHADAQKGGQLNTSRRESLKSARNHNQRRILLQTIVAICSERSNRKKKKWGGKSRPAADTRQRGTKTTCKVTREARPVPGQKITAIRGPASSRAEGKGRCSTIVLPQREPKDGKPGATQ